MRFKQALSRKLAAALSAVMILSTIAPTSVPVLAAAPDDVLVDSNVEYDLQDAGSEDVLLDSAESSLAEETDTLEVAGEELLAPETASDEVLVDSAEEVLSEETGIEPVEVGDVAEGTAPTEVTFTVSDFEADGKTAITAKDKKIIMAFKYLFKDGSNADVGTEQTWDLASANSISVPIPATAEKVFVKIPSASINSALYSTKYTASMNDAEFTVGDTGATYEIPTDKAATVAFKAVRTAYDGKLKLTAVSENILNAVTYHINAISPISEGDKPISANSVWEIPFKNATKVELSAQGDTIGSGIVGTDAYELSANKLELSQDDSNPTEIDLKAGDNEVTVRANVDSKFKTGRITIKVLSENGADQGVRSTDGILSINEVQAVLGDYAIAVKDDGTWGKAPYRTGGTPGVSTNNLKTASWGGQIVMDYRHAENIKIKVSDITQKFGLKSSRYQYKIGKEQVLYDNDATITLDGTQNQVVEITPVQVEFDTAVNFTTVSNNILKSFKFSAYNKAGTMIKPDGSTAGATPIMVNKAGDSTFDIKDLSYITISRTDTTDSDPLGGYVLRATQNGKTQTIDTADASTVKFEVDKDGNLAPITIEAVKNVKVTLSANAEGRPADNKISGFTWRSESAVGYDMDGNSVSDPVTGEAVSSLVDGTHTWFYVEQGKVVSLNAIGLAVSYPYLFPTVNGKVQDDVLKSASDAEWTLGAVAADTDFTLDVKEFSLNDENVFKLTPSFAGTVSIDSMQKGKSTGNTYDGYGQRYESNVKATLSDNWVFSDENSLDLQIKFTGKDGVNYTLDRLTYSYPTANGSGEGVVKAGVSGTDGNATATDSEGHSVISIPVDRVKAALLKNGSFELKVVEYDNEVKPTLTLAGSNIKEATVAVDGEYQAAINKSPYSPSAHIGYGKPLTFKATADPGFKIVSLNIATDNPMSTASGNSINEMDEKKLALLGTTGYVFAAGKFTDNFTATFNTEAIAAADVKYAAGTDKEVKKDSKGNYLVSSKRDVEIQYKFGSTASDFDYDVLVGKKSIFNLVSTDAVKKSGSGSETKLTFKGSDSNLQGKTVTLKLSKKDGSAPVEITFVVSSASSKVEFAKSEYTFPLGTALTVTGKVTGTVNGVAVVSGNTLESPAPDGMKLEWKDNKLTVTTKANLAVKKYLVNIVDAGDVSVVYGSVTVTPETETVVNAPEVVSKVTGTTNNKITISLKANKVDVKTDGLYYKVTWTVTGDKLKGYYKSGSDWVAADKTSYTVDLLDPATREAINNAIKNNNYDSLTTAQKLAMEDKDENAKIDITIQLVQAATKKGTAVATQKAVKTIKNDDIKLKEGGIFPTKITIKKGTKGKVWTTNNADHPFVFNVGYDKNASVREFTDVKLLNKDGSDTGLVGTFWDKDGETAINFKPAAVGLGAGTYILEVYALEPNGYDVTGRIKFNVEQAITNLDLSNMPEKIYKKSGKAAKAVAEAINKTRGDEKYYNKFYGKPAKNVEYSIVDKDDATGKEPSYVTSKMITINKNNGKITIKKDFMIDNTSFFVKVKTTDNTNRPFYWYSKRITVKTTADSDLKLAYIAQGENNFNANDIHELENGKAYYAGQLFFRGISEKGFENIAYVTVYDKEKNAAATPHFVPVDIKVSGAGKLINTYIDDGATKDPASSTYPTVAAIGLKKAGDIKLTVTSKDGSDRNIKKFTIKVNSVPGTVGFILQNADGVGVLNDTAKTLSYNNYAPLGERLLINVFGRYKDNKNVEQTDYIDHVIKVKNGNLIKASKDNMSFYYIEPKASKEGYTEVTLSNKDKSGAKTIKIYNKAISPSSAKKPKITASNVNKATGKDAKGKIYNDIDFTDVTGFTAYKDNLCNKVTYTLADVTADYVLVNASDFTIRKQIEDASADQNSDTAIAVDGDTYAIKTTKSAFYIDYSNMHLWVDDDADPMTPDVEQRNKGKFWIKKGTYKITITPAKLVKVDGVDKFEAIGKSVTLNVSAQPAPKANVKPKSSVTFNGKTGTIDTGSPKNYIPIAKGTYVFVDDLKGNNTKGKINNFKTYFSIDAAGKLTFKGDAKKTSLDPKNKEDKLELTGWVPYKYQALDGRVCGPVYVKITIKSNSTITK